MFYLQYYFNFHKRENFTVMNGQINFKIITYTDKCTFIIIFTIYMSYSRTSNLSIANILYSGQIFYESAESWSNSYTKPSIKEDSFIADAIFRSRMIICLETYLFIVDTLIFGQRVPQNYCNCMLVYLLSFS